MKASLSAGPCEDFTIPAVKLLSGLSTGVKHGTRLSATAISMVLWAVKIEPLSESPAPAAALGSRQEGRTLA